MRPNARHKACPRAWEECHGQTQFRRRYRRNGRRACSRRGRRAGGLSFARRHLHQSVPARRRRRRGGAPARQRDGAAAQAADRDRDQGGRRRRGRRPVRRRRQARRLHHPHPHRRRSPASPRSTGSTAARSSSPTTISSPSRASSPIRWCWSSTTSSRTRRCKEFVDAAKAKPNELIFSSSGLHGALHLPTALFMQAAGIQLRHLPTNGGGPALTALIGNNSQVLVLVDRGGQRADEGRQGPRARLLRRPSARPRCRTCRP